jgi:hypothetical protein
MEQSLSIPDALASDVNRFAASNDVSVDTAYELLLAVGLETLEGLTIEVSVENENLLLDCPGCSAVFQDPKEAIAHECEDN